MKRALVTSTLTLVAGAIGYLGFFFKVPNAIFLPPLARMQKGDPSRYSEAFDLHIKAAFPIGSTAEAMLQRLEREGFVRQPDVTARQPKERKWSLFIKPGIVCRFEYRVFWNAEDNRLADVLGAMADICL